MNFTFDPLWPWSALRDFMSGASVTVLIAAVVSGLAVLALPILVYLRPGGVSARSLLRGVGIGLVLLFAWVAIGGYRVSGGATGRLFGVGMSALFLLPFILVGLTIWTYLGVPGASGRRVAAILTFRLLALVLALLAMLRPSFAVPEPNENRDTLHVAVDFSESMTIKDELDNRSRWEQLLRILRDAQPTIGRLHETQQLDIVFHRFADDVSPFDPADPGKADGKRTEMGAMLRRLYESRDANRRLRGLLVLSDGADNGARFPALAEVARWRSLPCPVHTFSLGKPTTSDRQSDVILTAITPEPSPVPVKAELTVKVLIDAPGFENRQVRVKMFLDDKEVLAQDEVLRLTTGNEVKLKINAPTTPGEVKLTVRADDPRREGQALPGELSETNNEIGTYLTVTREGVSVLLVDKQRAFEPQFICDALAKDARIRLYPAWLRRDAGQGAAGGLFQFDKQQYDVIIIGDVTAKQLRAADADAPAAIEKLVREKGSGFLMLGGYATFGDGDWKGTEIEKLLPVDLNVRGQVENPLRMVPTEDGLRRYNYVLRLGDDRQDTVKQWDRLHELEGMTKLGAPKPGVASVLATTAGGDPLLVTSNYGNGRVLAFGGDTTHKWIRDPDTKQLHHRFWRQMILWLAKQEEAEGNVWVRPDTRRLPARSDLGFAVGLRSKGGIDLKNGTYQVEVTGPAGAKTPVAVAPAGGEDRGTFTKADAPGEYTILVRGEGKDPEGAEIKGEAKARFLVYDEDLETSRRAADHDFLKKLAAAGGGDSYRGEELTRFLEGLQPRKDEGKQKVVYYPNWKGTKRSPFLIGFFLAFVGLLGLEWLLRRRWGLA